MSSEKKKVPVPLDVPHAEHSTSDFACNYGTRLHINQWKTKDPKGVLVLVHGLGDHSGHMMTVVEHFTTTLHCDVYAYDQRGHGKSPGKRGHIDKFDTFVDDLGKFIDYVIEQAGDKLPLLLFGNSMGGLCTVVYLLQKQDQRITGAIVNGPALQVKDLAGVAGTFVGIASKVASNFSMEPKLESHKLTRDKEKQRENDEDPLVHTTTSMQLLQSIRTAGHYAMQNTENVKHSLLLIQGLNDPIVDPETSKRFVEAASKGNDKVKLFNTDGMHETFNDIDRDKVFQECDKFIEEILQLNLKRE